MSSNFKVIPKPETEVVPAAGMGLAVEVKNVPGGKEFAPLVWVEEFDIKEYQALDSSQHFVIQHEFDASAEPLFIMYKK